MIALFRCLSLLLVLPALGGCSKGASIKTVPVTGKVTLNGQPLSGATVTFLSSATGPDGSAAAPSSGVTGADGAYKLITMASGRDVADGIPPGDYKVIVTKPASGGANLSDPEFAAKMGTMSPEELQAAQAAKSEVPDRYGKPDASGLTAHVEASGAQTVDFTLTSP